MNYLAHLLLAQPTDDSRLGAIIGDFMSGQAVTEFTPGIQEGILLHRRIDEITDAHPVFRRSRGRVRESVGRFAGVVVDVVYDHFLARDWDRWSVTPLREFADETYALLERRFDESPPRLQRAVPYIVGGDWLMAYSRLPHLEQVFAGISRRVKRSNPFGEAFDAVRERYDELSRDFDEFFPELRAKVGAEH